MVESGIIYLAGCLGIPSLPSAGGLLQTPWFCIVCGVSVSCGPAWVQTSFSLTSPRPHNHGRLFSRLGPFSS